MNPSDRPRRWPLAFLVIALMLWAWASVALQLWFIQPFERQTPRGLAIAAFLRDAAPWLTLACLALALIASARLFREARLVGRALLVLACLATLGAALASRVNIFEKMFAPLPEPRFVEAGAVDFLEDGDMVLVVSAKGAGGDEERVAYPVRLLAYHHLVHDRVGDRAIVATY